MEFVFQESRVADWYWCDGCPPGFEQVTEEVIQTQSISLECWLRSIFVYPGDLDSKGKLIRHFFKRRGEVLMCQDKVLYDVHDATNCFFDDQFVSIGKAPRLIAAYLQTQLTPKEMLSLANVNIDKDFCFSILSAYLLNFCYLLVCGSKFRLLEIEFYYFDQEHRDPYPHCDKQQAQNGYWYFHRCPTKLDSSILHRTGNSYRNGTFKGLDISIGSKLLKAYGGILIRSLYHCEIKEVICGPSLCVDIILAASLAENISDFVETYLKKDETVENMNFQLCSRPSLSYRKEKVYRSMRIGLNLSKTDYSLEDQADYLTRAYRYFVYDFKLSKGRTHACLELIRQGQEIAKITKIFGSANLNNLQTNFKAGKKQKLKSFGNRKLADSDLAFLLGCLTQLSKAATDSD